MARSTKLELSAAVTRLSLLLAPLLGAAPVVAQPQTCPPQGDATQALARELNPFKNREDAPPIEKINPAATLDAMLVSGADLDRWSRDQGAILEGIVVGVKPGGIESVNCHARDAAHRDTHIELALSAGATPRQRVIVEVTPRMRDKLSVVYDWTTPTLRRELLGRRVRITGWLFDDLEHKAQAENSHPGGRSNWRATVWEIHPITGIVVLDGATTVTPGSAADPAANPLTHDRTRGHRKHAAN